MKKTLAYVLALVTNVSVLKFSTIEDTEGIANNISIPINVITAKSSIKVKPLLFKLII